MISGNIFNENNFKDYIKKIIKVELGKNNSVEIDNLWKRVTFLTETIKALEETIRLLGLQHEL